MKKIYAQWILISYVALLHVFAGILVAKTDFIPRLLVKLGLKESTEITTKDYFHLMLTFQQRMDQNVPDGSVVFLGDSITQGLAVDAVNFKAVNYGIGGQTTRELIYAIPYYRSALARASGIVVAIGVNDFFTGTDNGFTSRLSKILEILPADKPLVLSAILPVTITTNMKFSMDDIATANEAIKAVCKRHRKCVYVDASHALADSQRRPYRNYYLDDGIHLSPEGYREWIVHLTQALQQAQAK